MLSADTGFRHVPANWPKWLLTVTLNAKTYALNRKTWPKLYPKGPRTQIVGLQGQNAVIFLSPWDLQPYYLGPWTLRATYAHL